MKPVIDILEERISAVMGQVTGQESCAAVVKPASDAKFGDYQANGVMGLAKKVKRNPKELAEKIVEKLDVSAICEKPEVAGPGFINLRLKPEFVSKALLEVNADSANRLGISKVEKTETVVVDFSGPNIAKEMHVGHLRSTIIGDCICRVLEFLGHKIIRQNHIGDWGLQMGIMLHEKVGTDLIEVEDLVTHENHYKTISELMVTNDDVAKNVREITARLQRGHKPEKEYWEHVRKVTLKTCFEIYDTLGGVFTEEDVRGESFYKDMLVDVVEELKKKDLAEESEGAVCVFPEGFKNKEGEPLPLIVRKSDGAYLYATTDLAAIRYRVNELKADRIIYVTDARQQLHFEMVFAVAKTAGWAKDTELVHVTFGSVLGEDGKPLKTREGENVKLKELLDEAVEKAKAVVEEKNPELSAEKKQSIAKAVGIGAVKYADYSNNRSSDYIFSFDKMLAMDGNTAPYMQYAYARIKSIERKAESKDVDIETELSDVRSLNLDEPQEMDLAKNLIKYGEAIESAAMDYRPNYLTAYLYELAQKFSAFYTNCPVLGAGPDKRPTRLLLCDLTARTIKHGLSELLGIDVVEQM